VLTGTSLGESESAMKRFRILTGEVAHGRPLIYFSPDGANWEHLQLQG